MHLILMTVLIYCCSDSISARALQVRVDAGNTTVESCVAACQAQEYSLAGLEYGQECCTSITRARIPVVVHADHW